MRCPYCNTELEPETYIVWPGEEGETGRLCCPNPKCSCHCQALEPDIYELLSEGKKAFLALESCNALLNTLLKTYIKPKTQEARSIQSIIDGIRPFIKQNVEKRDDFNK